MMKEKWAGLAFLVPFGFLSLWADWAYGWDWAWVLLGAGAVLAGGCVGHGCIWLAGNGISLGLSVLCVELFGLRQYDYYFKPFGAVGLAGIFYGVTMGIAWLVRKKQWLILGLVLGFAGLMFGVLYSLQLSLRETVWGGCRAWGSVAGYGHFVQPSRDTPSDSAGAEPPPSKREARPFPTSLTLGHPPQRGRAFL